MESGKRLSGVIFAGSPLSFQVLITGPYSHAGVHSHIDGVPGVLLNAPSLYQIVAFFNVVQHPKSNPFCKFTYISFIHFGTIEPSC